LTFIVGTGIYIAKNMAPSESTADDETTK